RSSRARSTRRGPPTAAAGRSGSGTLAEVDWAIAPALERGHQPVHVADLVVELGGAQADEAHQVRIAAPERRVAVLADELLDACVFPAAASSVQRLDRDHTLEHGLGLVMRAEPDVRPPRMTGERHAAEPGDLDDDLLCGEPHVGEVETSDDVLIDAVDEHVTVIGL